MRNAGFFNRGGLFLSIATMFVCVMDRLYLFATFLCFLFFLLLNSVLYEPHWSAGKNIHVTKITLVGYIQ